MTSARKKKVFGEHEEDRFQNKNYQPLVLY